MSKTSLSKSLKLKILSFFSWLINLPAFVLKFLTKKKKAEDVEMNGEQKDQQIKGLTEFGLPNLQRVIKKEGPINAELL